MVSSCFSPAVKEYCPAKNFENKALILFNNAPGHPTNLDDLTNNVKVLCLQTPPVDSTYGSGGYSYIQSLLFMAQL